MKLKIRTPLAGLALLAACASEPQLTREQSLAITTRAYSGHSPGEVLDAARQVFELADAGDYSFTYPDARSMKAERFWLMYSLVLYQDGTDSWTVAIDEDGTAHASAVFNKWGIVGRPPLYELFWARVDYLLGERADWPPCPTYSMSDEMDYWSLCGVGIEDREPA